MGSTDDGRYVTEVPVRWSDLDALGHVNNAKTVTLLEEARIQWLFVDGAGHGLESLTEALVVAEMGISYKRPIGFGQPVSVAIGVVSVGNASFTVDYQVRVGQQLVTTAHNVLVAIDPATGRPRRVDDAARAFLSRYQVDSAA